MAKNISKTAICYLSGMRETLMVCSNLVSMVKRL
ncbi:hypothetical protein ACHAW6_013857 [Cyclotella cf. meneghiniana]